MNNFKTIGEDGRELIPHIRLHPGDILKDEIEARGLKKSAFAKMLGISPTQLSELLHGKRHVSEDLALRLEQVLDIDAATWMRIQTQYNLAKKRLEQPTAPQLSMAEEEPETYTKRGDNKNDSAILVFQDKQIRRILYENDWYFNLVDVIEILSESPQPTVYWSKLKRKLIQDEGIDQLFPIWKQLKFEATNGKFYNMDAANTEGVFRIIMSVASPKAEPFKRWLAEVGKQTIDEMQDPELGFERMKEIYKAKGYSNEWIERRIQTIDTRKQLTDQWKNRGVQEGQEYSILTAIIAKGTFGLTPSEHKEMKGLTHPKHNLRDHMTPLELIFTALGEEATRQMAIRDDAKGFIENVDVAREGGDAAGEARERLEKRLRQKVVSDKNFLNQQPVPPKIEE